MKNLKTYDCMVFIKGVGLDTYRVNAEDVLDAIQVCRDRVSNETDYNMSRVEVLCVDRV